MPVVPFTPATRNQLLVPAVLIVLYTIFAVGMSSLVFGWFPFAMSETQWRFSSALQLLKTGPQIATILMMAVIAAMFGANYRSVRWSAIMAMAFGALLVVVLPFFALDFLTARHLQSQEVLPSYTREGFRIMATSLMLGIALGYAGWQGFKASGTMLMPATDPVHGLVVGQEIPQDQ